MLQLRVYGDPARMSAVAERLDGLAGARHVSVIALVRDAESMVLADLRADAADSALETLQALDVGPDDIALVRLDVIAPGSASDGAELVWAEVLGQARLRARTHARYVVLMASAGVIASLGVLNDNSTLIVGAMAISPDLMPVTAACTGLVLRRWRLAERGLITLTFGLLVAGLFALVASVILNGLDLLPTALDLNDPSLVQTHTGPTTILVAFAAGIAGMLAVETRASAAVGVAISVTTIPAAAYLGVALGVGAWRSALPAVGVLVANIVLMVAGGSLVLAVQRRQRRVHPRREDPGAPL